MVIAIVIGLKLIVILIITFQFISTIHFIYIVEGSYLNLLYFHYLDYYYYHLSFHFIICVKITTKIIILGFLYFDKIKIRIFFGYYA